MYVTVTILKAPRTAHILSETKLIVNNKVVFLLQPAAFLRRNASGINWSGDKKKILQYVHDIQRNMYLWMKKIIVYSYEADAFVVITLEAVFITG